MTILRILLGRCRLSLAELYEGASVSHDSLATSRSLFATLSTSSNSDVLPSPPATPSSSASATPRRRGRKYKPEVLEYFARVKDWNKQMNILKTEWRTTQLLKHRAEESQKQALQIFTSKKSQQEGMQEPRQVQQALEEELRKTELEVELAEIKLQRAHRFEKAQARIQRIQEDKREALLKASRNWVRREELLDRITAALDNPLPFGFVSPVSDAKKVL